MVVGYALATWTAAAAAAKGSPPPALFALSAVAIIFEIYCLVTVFRTKRVRYLPRWVWAIICLVSIPLGGIIFLVVGKEW